REDAARVLERREGRRAGLARRHRLHRLRLHCLGRARLAFHRRLRRRLLLFGRAGREREARRAQHTEHRTHGIAPFHSMNGPQVGSRTSPAAVLRRCLTRPSADTAESTPRSPITVASRIMRPLGEKLGDSSRSLSVRICTCRLERSSSATWNLPLLPVMYARVFPSGLILGETL